MATRTMIFGFIRKTMANFRREHGNSETILDALMVVIKLLPTLKHVINLNSKRKGPLDYECT